MNVDAPRLGCARHSLFELPARLLTLLLSPRPNRGRLSPEILSMARDRSIDWNLVAADAEKHVVHILVHQRLDELGLTQLLGKKIARSWESNRRHAELQCSIQQQDAENINRSFEDRNIRHAFLKGCAYRQTFYEPTWVRPSADLDLLIFPEDIEPARKAMVDLGFVQASRTKDFREFRPAGESEILETELHHYELAQFARSYLLLNGLQWLLESEFTRGAPFTYESLPEGPALHSVVDIHWALHFLTADQSPLDVDQSFVVTPEGRKLPTLTIEWSIFYTSFKLYLEAFEKPGRGLHQLIDLVALLKHGESQIKWKVVDELTKYYRFEAPLFYALSAASQFLETGVVPLSVLDEWNVMDPLSELSRNEASEHASLDVGDFLPILVGRRLTSQFFR